MVTLTAGQNCTNSNSQQKGVQNGVLGGVRKPIFLRWDDTLDVSYHHMLLHLAHRFGGRFASIASEHWQKIKPIIVITTYQAVVQGARQRCGPCG
jgi:hypothetical protein